MGLPRHVALGLGWEAAVASEAENQVNALGVLGNAIKATPAAAKVDTNSVLFTLGSAVNWGFVPAGGVLDCQPVFNILTEKGASLSEAATVCLLLHRREDRLGVVVKLPAQVEGLSEDVRADLIANLPKQAGTGLTVTSAGAAVRPAAPRAARAPTAAQGPAKGKASGRQESSVRLPGVKAPGALQRMGISPGTLVLCVLIVAAGSAAKYAMREKLPEPVTLELPAGTAHLKATRFDEHLYLYDPMGDFNQSDERLQAMAAQLAPVLEAAGFKRAYLCLREEPVMCRVPKAMLRGTKLLYINKRPPVTPPPAAD
jgi:hypothetical protein